ncbi:MAG: Sec-independent protein translocase protein TatB [Pseudomonadota bacterium]|nr:Sec-independent protein translocase protein TatB [Pseudomonadota bacterium]
MFDVGFSEVVIIAIIALVILGPERLPKVARTLGFWVGKARRMVADVKSDIDREMRESELADLRKLGDEITDVKDEIEKTGSDAVDDSSLVSVADSIRDSAEDIQSTVKDTAEVAEARAQDSTQDNAEETPAETDPSMAPEKQAAT